MSSPSKSINCSSEDDNELRRGPWTHEEDELLTKSIANHGEGRWNLLAKRSGLRRTGKSCRLRWLNYLKPDVKRGNLTPEEQLLIFELHSKWGNRWSKIAQQLPGRTDNEIKNYWRTRIQKQVKYLKIDTDRPGFHEMLKGLWRTRFLQKAKESSPSSAISIQNQAIPLPHDGVSQYSVIETTPTTQIPCHGTCVKEAGSNCLDQHVQNSDSEHNNGSCMSSLESANIPYMHQLLGYTTSTSQFQALDNSDFGTNAYDSYQANNNAYEMMDPFNMTATMAGEDVDCPIGDCQMSGSNWLDSDFACSMWNMDELWQFRSILKQ